MKKFLITLDHKRIVEAENEEEAVTKFFEEVEGESQQTLDTFVFDNTEATEATKEEIEEFE